jgi:hypothetical protein
MDHAPDARIMIYCEVGSIKFALTKSVAALLQRRGKKVMRKTGSKTPAEKQQYETPDDLSIPDFLRRPAPSTATANKNHNQSATA